MSTKVVDFLINEIEKKVNKPGGLVPACELKITPGRFKPYLSASLIEQRQVHQSLEALSRSLPGLKVIYPVVGFNEERRIELIQVPDSRAFLQYFKRPVKADLFKRAADQLEAASFYLPGWAQAVKESAVSSWREGRLFSGYGHGDYQKIIDGLLFINHCEKSGFEATDIRTLSAKLYKDSKKLATLASLIAAIYKPQLPEALQTAKSDEVLEYLGIYRFPPVLSISGPLNIMTRRGLLSAAQAWPYLGVPPDGVERVTVSEQPAYVLFIENKTTFERYVRQIDDAGLVLYTHGFPSRKWQDIFRLLDKEVDGSVPFFHWGDLDVGGCRILCFIQSLLERELVPYHMEPQSAADDEHSSGFRMIDITDIKQVLESQGSASIKALVARLAELELTTDSICWIEQEYLEIRSPIDAYKE